jgi:hypothetical protein
MNWSIRYAREWKKVRQVNPTPSNTTPSTRQWRTVRPPAPVPSSTTPSTRQFRTVENKVRPAPDWSATVPTVPEGKKIKGFTGALTFSGGGSTYNLNSDGTYTKTLAAQAQEEYKTTRPGKYKILNSQGQYQDTYNNTVFIHPMHAEGLSSSHKFGNIGQIAHQQPDGSFAYLVDGDIRGLPSSHIVPVTSDGRGFGTYRIPAHQISTTPFVGAMPFQHGTITYADGSQKSNVEHVGSPVGEVHYE